MAIHMGWTCLSISRHGVWTHRNIGDLRITHRCAECGFPEGPRDESDST